MADGASNKRTKDQAMSTRMKAEKVTRTSARYPICNKVKPLPLYNHIAFHTAHSEGK